MSLFCSQCGAQLEEGGVFCPNCGSPRANAAQPAAPVQQEPFYPAPKQNRSKADAAKYDIFISYRRDGGSETAKMMRDSLTERGYRVFLDIETLRSGQFNSDLYRFIEQATDVVLILPANALDRCQDPNDWLRLEIEHAKRCRKNIVPIMLKGFSFPAVLPPSLEFLRTQNALAANIEYYDAYIEKLTDFLIAKPRRFNKKLWLPIIAAAAVAVIVLAVVLILKGGGDGSKAVSGSDSETVGGSEPATVAVTDGHDSPEAVFAKMAEMYSSHTATDEDIADLYYEYHFPKDEATKQLAIACSCVEQTCRNYGDDYTTTVKIENTKTITGAAFTDVINRIAMNSNSTANIEEIVRVSIYQTNTGSKASASWYTDSYVVKAGGKWYYTTSYHG